jgi:hypothetical protein
MRERERRKKKRKRENERKREKKNRRKKDAADFLCVRMLTMYVSTVSSTDPDINFTEECEHIKKDKMNLGKKYILQTFVIVI